MTEVKLYDGCFVRLADGSVCGPVRKYRDYDIYCCIGLTWPTHGWQNNNNQLTVTAVYPSLSALAEGEG